MVTFFQISVTITVTTVIMAAAKRVVSLSKIYNEFKSKSDDLFKEIDNWSARINSLLELDIRKEDCSFSDVLKFLEFFNFLSGEYDLLYHGQIKVVEEIMAKRDGYSHDFLRGHLTIVGEKQSSTWIDTRALILNSDLKIIPGVQRRERSKKKKQQKKNKQQYPQKQQQYPQKQQQLVVQK